MYIYDIETKEALIDFLTIKTTTSVLYEVAVEMVLKTELKRLVKEQIASAEYFEGVEINWATICRDLGLSITSGRKEAIERLVPAVVDRIMDQRKDEAVEKEVDFAHSELLEKNAVRNKKREVLLG